MATIHVKTESGFECDVNDQVVNDMELLELLIEIEGGNTRMYPRVLAKTLSQEDKKALYDHVRTEDGRVPYDAIAVEINDIYSAIQGGKN